MHLIQILLPLSDNDSRTFPAELYGRVRAELSERFGGITAFTRAPAQGLWKDAGKTVHDDIVVLEVMVETVDAAWWRAYRQELEKRFQQESIVVRAQELTLL